MNKSKTADDRRLITQVIDNLQQGLMALDFEFGAMGDKIPKFVCHDTNTWSLKTGGKTFKFVISVEND